MNTAEIMESTLIGWALAAYSTHGLIDRLAGDGVAVIDASSSPAAAATDVLVRAGMVARSTDGRTSTVRTTPLFTATLPSLGYLEWLWSGYGPLLSAAMRPERSIGRSDHDPAGAASGARRAGQEHIDPTFFGVVAPELRSLGHSVVCDLGCGAGHRIDRLVHENGFDAGVGVDIAAATIERAVAEYGADPCLDFVVDDMRRPQHHPRFDAADLLLIFLAGHDLWPAERAVATLREYRSIFPAVTRFVLCDTYRPAPGEDVSGLFLSSFLAVHELLGEYVPTLEEWDGVFADSGWQVESVHPTGVPSTQFWVLTPDAIPTAAP